MKKIFLISLFLILVLSNKHTYADRIKDMASVAGVRSNQLVGYGLVIGLSKTGDGSVNLTKQNIAAMVSQFGVIASTADIDATNSAGVMITANLPPFAKPGQTIDVTVSTIGKAKSLKGGTLLIGVSDTGEIKGIERDLMHFFHNSIDCVRLILLFY